MTSEEEFAEFAAPLTPVTPGRPGRAGARPGCGQAARRSRKLVPGVAGQRSEAARVEARPRRYARRRRRHTIQNSADRARPTCGPIAFLAVSSNPRTASIPRDANIAQYHLGMLSVSTRFNRSR